MTALLSFHCHFNLFADSRNSINLKEQEQDINLNHKTQQKILAKNNIISVELENKNNLFSSIN